MAHYCFVFTLASMALQGVCVATGQSARNREVQHLYNSDVNLTCADLFFQPLQHPDAHFQWLFPNGNIVDGSSEGTSQRHTFYNNGATLFIRQLDKENAGVYRCLVQLPGQHTVHAVITQSISLYGNLWEQYTPNLKTGFYAGFIVFIVMSLFCFNLDQFQNRHDKGPQQSPKNVEIALQSYISTPGVMMACTNTAFVQDEDQEIKEKHVDSDSYGLEKQEPAETAETKTKF